MLRINTDNALRLALKAAYSREVANRVGNNFWSFPKKYDVFIEPSLRAIESCEASVGDYVKAQFDGLPKEFCLRIFRLTYPPMGCMVGPRAKARYEKYLQTVMSYEKKTGSERERIILETSYNQFRMLWRTKDHLDPDKLALLVLSKSVSLHTLAFMQLNKDLKAETVGSVLSYLFEDIGEGDIHERYRNIKREMGGYLGIKDEG